MGNKRVPERCPFLSTNRRCLGVCTLLHKKPAPNQVGCPEFYDAHMVMFRYCLHSNFMGDGYLLCAIFTKNYWRKGD